MEKPASDLGSGFFSITVTAEDISGIIDDTYSYKLSQLDVILKLGFVRVIEGEIIILDDAELDAELDFILA